ncbi:MAG: ABC transporter ATP-binding protein/permease [Odoribacteraceae bacterium]|nr:ABC transporter ATP-binding protein/permease [Odoribacteraceae bacterium]
MTRGDEDKPRRAGRAARRLFAYFRGDRLPLLVAALLLLAGVLALLLASYALRPVINDYILAGDTSGLARALMLPGGLYVAAAVATYFQYRVLNGIGQRVVARLRADLFRHVERLPVGYIEKRQHGDLTSRFINDIDQLSLVLTDSLTDILSAALSLTGAVVMMLYINPTLAAVALVTIPLMALATRFIARRARAHSRAQQIAVGALDGVAEEMISGIKAIKVFGREREAAAAFERENKRLEASAGRAQFYSGLMMPVVQNLNAINFVLITIAGALLSIYRGFDVGGLAVFLQYARQAGRPLNELATLYNTIQAAIAGVERVFQVIDEPGEEEDSPDAVALDNPRGAVTMRDVWFEYEPGKPVLKGITFSVSPGERVALVGETGAGKSTILGLLPRFRDVTSGEITIDGVPVRRVTRASLRRAVTIVLQDARLFTGSVRENIRAGRQEATDKEIEEAARLVGAHGFIERLPDGYDTLLENDGARLSQGERQLLHVARAAAENPAVLLLDEATSNVDARGEALVREGLERVARGRTILVIAHRLSTIAHVDRILVVDDGRVVEEGTRDELLARRGKYHALYREQFPVD